MEEEGFINGYDEDELWNSLPPPIASLNQEAQERDQREQQNQQRQQQRQQRQQVMQIETTQNIPDNQIHREETLPPMNIQQVPIIEPNNNTLIVPRHDGEQILLDRTELTKLGYVMNIKSDLLFSDQNRINNNYTLPYDDLIVGKFNIYYCAPQNGKLGYYATDIGKFPSYRLCKSNDKELVNNISNSILPELRGKSTTYWSIKCDAQRYFMFFYLFYYCTDIEEFDVYITKRYEVKRNEEDINNDTIAKFDLRRQFTNNGFYLTVQEKDNESKIVTRFMFFSCKRSYGVYHFDFATNIITKLPALKKEQPVLDIIFRAKIFDSGYLRLYESLRNIFWMNSVMKSFHYYGTYSKDKNIELNYYMAKLSELNSDKFIKQQRYPDDDPEKYPGEVQMSQSIFNFENYFKESAIINDYAISIINMTRHGYQPQQPIQGQLQYNVMDNNIDTISTQQNKPEKSMEEIDMQE